MPTPKTGEKHTPTMDRMRTATICEVCLKPMPRRRTDRYATGHSKCWAVWRKEGCNMEAARAAIAKATQGGI